MLRGMGRKMWARKRNEKNVVINYGVDCEPWKGHHWILVRPKGKGEN